jgi:hypothetical protein
MTELKLYNCENTSTLNFARRLYLSFSKDYWKSSLSTVFIILKIPRIEKEQWETLSLHRGSGVNGSKDTRCPVQIFFPQCHTCPLLTSWCPLQVVAEVWPTSEVGTPMRRSYVVRMRWMVIHEFEVPGGALTKILLNYSDHGHNGNLPPQEKIPMVDAGIEPGTSWSVVRNSDH